jgi:uncharacterized protein (TIGR01244 family)
MSRLLGLRILAAALVALSGCATTTGAQRAAPDLAIAGAKRPVPGVLVTGQPTEAQLKEASEKGYGTVINLRPADEPGALSTEAELAQRLGMRMVQIPIAGAKDLTPENVKRFAAALDEAAQDGRPVLAHCASGNRVGALFALKAFQLDGKSEQQALDEGRKAGLTKLEPAVKAIIEAP